MVATGSCAFVSNNGFSSRIASTGFESTWSRTSPDLPPDLEGNVRTSAETAKTGRRKCVSTIRVGVGITVPWCDVASASSVCFSIVSYQDYCRAEQKRHGWPQHGNAVAREMETADGPMRPDDWLVPRTAGEFSAFRPLATKEAKAGR